MPDFSNAKVGDKVFSLVEGWGIICAIRKDMEYPIRVEYPNCSLTSYTIDGKLLNNSPYPILFWDSPKMSDPPKPKIIVKKKEVIWFNKFRCKNGETKRGSIFTSKEDAECYSHINGFLCTVQGELHWEEEQ